MTPKRFVILSLLTVSCGLASATEVETMPTAEMDSVKVVTETAEKNGKFKNFMQKANPSLKFGGFIVGKYSIDDKRSASKSYNNSFDMRYLRLYANGYCFDDFYYRFQLEVNGSPGEDRGPRLLDAFVEWQKYDFAKIKFG